MRKCVITIIVFLCSFLSVNLLFAATFTQADLTGTWRMNLLRTGFHSDGTTPINKWMRIRLTINSSGVATCLSMSDSDGVTTCPGEFDLTLTMNPSTGVITQTGGSAANADTDHMTMTSNKNFAAGTATNGDGPGYSYHLVILQKEVTGTVYSAADLQSKSIVYHQLEVGAASRWRYGTGTIDGTGALTTSSETTPSGTTGTHVTGWTASVDGNGVVSMSGGGAETFQGFLSDDKKTLVGTFTEGTGTIYKLIIIQVTGQTYTAGLLLSGTLFTHVLGCGAEPFWVHYTHAVDSSGSMTFSDWVASDPAITAPVTPLTGHISTSGTVTMDGDATFHGQVSHDGTFTVATQTGGANFYMLSVSTKATSSDTLYADLGAYGIWKHDGTSWSFLAPENPEQIVASGSTLYADLGAYGIWKHDGTAWSKLAPEDPEGLTIGY
jgi:hypothetical protein